MKHHVDSERLSQVVTLSHGHHRSPEDGMCVMEAVSYVSGEPWSDRPQCACPVISKMLMYWNDGISSNFDRDRLLKPLIPKIVGSRCTPEVEKRRGYMALDWLIRVHTPKWLDLLPELREHASALRNTEAITDDAAVQVVSEKVRAAWRDACVSAQLAVRALDRTSPEWDESVFPDLDPSFDAAWHAGRAANIYAWNSVLSDARDVASNVCICVTKDDLDSTLKWSQSSAIELIHSMLSLKS